MEIDDLPSRLKEINAQLTSLRQFSYSDFPDVDRHIRRYGEWNCQLMYRVSKRDKVPHAFPVWGTGHTPSAAIEDAISKWKIQAAGKALWQQKREPAKPVQAASGDDLLKLLGL